ncbi:MAG: hypothetical protein MHPSP_000411, partial [Paramarteilia canceri]
VYCIRQIDYGQLAIVLEKDIFPSNKSLESVHPLCIKISLDPSQFSLDGSESCLKSVFDKETCHSISFNPEPNM